SDAQSRTFVATSLIRWCSCVSRSFSNASRVLSTAHPIATNATDTRQAMLRAFFPVIWQFSSPHRNADSYRSQEQKTSPKCFSRILKKMGRRGLTVPTWVCKLMFSKGQGCAQAERKGAQKRGEELPP